MGPTKTTKTFPYSRITGTTSPEIPTYFVVGWIPAQHHNCVHGLDRADRVRQPHLPLHPGERQISSDPLLPPATSTHWKVFLQISTFKYHFSGVSHILNHFYMTYYLNLSCKISIHGIYPSIFAFSCLTKEYFI